MNKKLIWSALLLISSVTLMFSQNIDSRKVFGKPVAHVHHNGTIRCVADEYNSNLRDRGLLEDRMAFENWLSVKISEMEEAEAKGDNEVLNILTIPVVVHVIHSGQAVGTGRNISDARVLSQITVLNQDYRRMPGTPGFNDNPVGADVQIEFCLAQRTPNNLPTNGINRVNLGNTIWNETNVETILKPQTQWDPTRYFNIWVTQFGGDLNGVLGYAQFPSSSGVGGLPGFGGPAITDGVVIDWRCFGNSQVAPGQYFSFYDRGRTTTHEIGHALGLIHIWGDNSSCTVNAQDSFQDWCPDTPPSNGPNETCAVVFSCPASGLPDMVENYMDYTNDTCFNTFTQNQRTRMRTVMQNSPRRNTLPTSNACQAPMSSPEYEMIQGIKLYPNPASDIVVLQIPDGNLYPESITIYNSIGQQIKQKQVSNLQDLSIPVADLQSGVYFIRVSIQNEHRTLQFTKK